MSENQNNLRQMSAADIPQTLPSFPSEDGSGSAVVVPDDIPQTLPSFPSVDGSGNPIPDTPQTLPSFPQPIPPSNNTPNQPTTRCCRVRFFHAAAQAGAVNVNVGSQRVATNLAFGNFSTYYCFGQGFRTVTVLNASSNRTVLLRKTVPMQAGETITFVLLNNASTGTLELSRIDDTSCSGQMGGFACLRMANFLLGNTALDMMTSDGRVVFSDVRYKENTLSRRLRPGSYSFYVVNTPLRIEPRIEDVELDDSDYRVSGRYLPGYGELSPVISFSLQARRGVMYTAYIIGQANTDEIQVVIAANS